MPVCVVRPKISLPCVDCGSELEDQNTPKKKKATMSALAVVIVLGLVFLLRRQGRGSHESGWRTFEPILFSDRCSAADPSMGARIKLRSGEDFDCPCTYISSTASTSSGWKYNPRPVD